MATKEEIEEVEVEEEEEELYENPLIEPKETPAWLAAIGTYSTLVAYNKLVCWLSSFLDVPPGGILARNAALSASNVLIGELLARKVMKGPGVDTAIRFGYAVASVQTMATGIYEYSLKKKFGKDGMAIPKVDTVEKAVKLLEGAKEDYDKAAKRLKEAHEQYTSLAQAQNGQSQPSGDSAGQQQGQGQTQSGQQQAKPISGVRIGRRESNFKKKSALGGMGM